MSKHNASVSSNKCYYTLTKKQYGLLIGIAVVMLTALFYAYKDHFHNPFEFDDAHTIVNNTAIRDIRNIPLFFKDARTFSTLPANQVYRPGVTTLNAIDYWLSGEKGTPTPFWFHVSIFTSFIVLGVFIFLFSKKVYDLSLPSSVNPFIALLTAGVFMLHTANAETINYIIARSDSFSTLMILISLWMFTYEKLRKYQLYLIPMAIGFTVKEPTIMVAPLAFLYLYFFVYQRGLQQLFSWKDTLKILLPVLPAFILAGLLFIISSVMASADFLPGTHTRWEYLRTQPFVIVHYVNNYFFPFNLSADTDWNVIQNPFDERVTFGILFVGFTLYIAYKSSLNALTRPIAYGILWFYLALAPTSSIVPLAEVLNDHRVFFPYIGLTIAVVWTLYNLYRKYESIISSNIFLKSLAVLAVVVYFTLHVYGIRQRCEVWSSPEKLWYDVTIKSPRNGRGLMNYANALMAKGDFKGAEEYFTKAKNVWPYYSYVYINFGVLYSRTSRLAEAEENFKYALKLDPKNPASYYYYAYFLMNNGRSSEANALVNDGLKVSPTHTDLLNLKNELTTNPLYAQDIKSKLEMLEKLCATNPTPENYINLSLEYYYQQRYLDCVRAAEKALELRPGYDIAYNNICSAYNMLKEWDKAIEACEKGVAANPNNQLIKNNLAAAKRGKGLKP
ncbi:MAG: tetratricopeptide repeat protein [Chitinophagales bacterium]|nr:tetratricopeptide repeat protein [Chitinophagales bacterium]